MISIANKPIKYGVTEITPLSFQYHKDFGEIFVNGFAESLTGSKVIIFTTKGKNIPIAASIDKVYPLIKSE